MNSSKLELVKELHSSMDTEYDELLTIILNIKSRLCKTFKLSGRYSLQDIVHWVEENKGLTKQIFEGECRHCGWNTTVAEDINHPAYTRYMRLKNAIDEF